MRVRPHTIALSALLSVAVAFAAAPALASGSVLSGRAAQVAHPSRDRTSTETGRVVVGLSSMRGASALSAATDLGAQTLSVSSDADFAVVDPPAGVSPEELAAQLAAEPGVRFAEPEHYVYAAWVPNDLAPELWGPTRIGLPKAWDYSRGYGVKIAVIDTGIMSTHEDLAGSVVGGYNFVANNYDYMDDNGHGTHVAGIAAARTGNWIGIAGTAGQSSLLAAKALDAQGRGTDGDLADAIHWSVDQGAGVINMSLTSPEYSTVIAEAVKYAESRNVIVVAAAGNDGCNQLSFPAALPGVVSVGAIDNVSAWAEFSNAAPELDMSAPGVGIWSTVRNMAFPSQNNWYAAFDGTSMASPFAAGSAALLRAYRPAYSADLAVAVMRRQVEGVGAPGPEDETGFGVLRADSNLILNATGYKFWGEIPGYPLSTSPVVAASPLSSTDPIRVYEVMLLDGQTLDASVQVDASCTASLGVFGRRTTLVATATPVVQSATDASGSASVSFKAPSTGSYYLCVKRLGGTGSYTLTHSITDIPEPDDDIPGAALGSSPVTGTVDRAGDRDDVMSVYLGEGEGLRASISGIPLTDNDLVLFGPGTGAGFTSTPVAASAGAGSQESFEYSVPAGSSGAHYVVVDAYRGTGPYTLTWHKAAGSSVSLGAPTTCSWGGSARVYGKLSGSDGSGVLAGKAVRIDALPYGATAWTLNVASSTTASDGSFAAYVRPSKQTKYRARFAGDAERIGTTSSVKTVTPKAYLTTPSAPSTVYKGHTFSAYGYLKPRHTSGAKNVKLSCYRLESGRWVARKTVYATNSNYSLNGASATKYLAKYSLPYAGKWKIVASITGDSVHASTTSGTRYVTAR